MASHAYLSGASPANQPDAHGITGGRARSAAAVMAPALSIAAMMALGFLAVAAQLVRLAANGQGSLRLQASEPIVRSYARADIVDRKGRLLATDLGAHSLYADPALVLDADEAAEKLAAALPGLDATELRGLLADRSRRFVWIRRGLAPAMAQRIHDLGLPGLQFRTEPKRSYPQGRLAGHILGSVGIDNRALSGIERHIDEELGLESGLSGDFERPPVVLTIDLGVQHGLEQELAAGVTRFGASGAAGVLLDVDSGEVLAAASVPDVDPARGIEALEAARIDRLQVATYELGSIFKAFTVAIALDLGIATPDTIIDVRAPLQVGRFAIRDLHSAGRPLSVREIFIQSSNVGAGRLAQATGRDRQRAYLTRLGLTTPMRTEVGAVAAPRGPDRWGEVELVTIAYGHGLALAPIQFAAAAAAIVNGGFKVEPRFIKTLPGVVRPPAERTRVLSAETSRKMTDLMRRNVTQSNATGRRADVPGFEVGGKTGTAEMATAGGYAKRSVVASFLAAFPMSAPRYLLLVTLIEPKPETDARGHPDARGLITAGVNAAPLAAQVIARAAPLLGLAPR